MAQLRILAPTSNALALANRIAAAGPYNVEIWQRPGSLTQALRQSIEARIPTLAICATGIAARTLAETSLPPKAETAPLVCATEDGQHFIPLLGGHQGANDLARTLAADLGGQAIITTLSDQRFDVALDSPPAGWHLVAAPPAFSAFMQALLERGSADLSRAPLWVRHSAIPHEPASPLTIHAHHGPAETASPSTAGSLNFASTQHLALGMGCEKNCPEAYVEELLAQAEQALGLTFPRPLPAASIDLKRHEPAFNRLAPEMAFYPAAHLNSFDVPTPSQVVLAEVGTKSVAEASALALSGEGGQLILPKIKNSKATLAVATSLHPISPAPAAQLNIIGLGPGNAALVSPQALAALGAADIWVGYSLYLDQAQGMVGAHTPRLDFNLGDEEARCRAALDEAAKGTRVALICSGDPQVYAMAQVVYELLARHSEREDWQRTVVETLPGITAMQALAAKVGAPMGHDFCAISLSDLNTPWEVIEKKVQAAAEADFVIGFYNPRSKKRDWQLPRALEILKQHRPADCPVAFGRNVSRPDEAIRRTTLTALNPEDIDMFTCLIVGASFTQRHQDYIFTPRGYTLDGKQGK